METNSTNHTSDTDSKSQNSIVTLSAGARKLLAYAIPCLLIIGTGLGVYYWQNARVAESKDDISSVIAEKDSLTKDKQSLETKNKNLSESVEVLQEQLSYNKTTSQATQSSSNAAATMAKPVTKLTVSFVKSLPGTQFAKPGYTPPQGSFNAIYATIINQGDKEQSYEIHQFSAITKSGSVVKPQIFSPVETQGLWNNSVIPPGDTQDAILLFAQDQDIVVLTYTPESSSDSVSVSLPVVQ